MQFPACWIIIIRWSRSNNHSQGNWSRTSNKAEGQSTSVAGWCPLQVLTNGDVVLLWRMTLLVSQLLGFFFGRFFFSPTTSPAVDEWRNWIDCSKALKSLNFGLVQTVKKKCERPFLALNTLQIWKFYYTKSHTYYCLCSVYNCQQFLAPKYWNNFLLEKSCILSFCLQFTGSKHAGSSPQPWEISPIRSRFCQYFQRVWFCLHTSCSSGDCCVGNVVLWASAGLPSLPFPLAGMREALSSLGDAAVQ